MIKTSSKYSSKQIAEQILASLREQSDVDVSAIGDDMVARSSRAIAIASGWKKFEFAVTIGFRKFEIKGRERTAVVFTVHK